MCIAILRILWRDGHREAVDVETAEALAERIAKLESNPEAAEYRVFNSCPKRVQVAQWEDRP